MTNKFWNFTTLSNGCHCLVKKGTKAIIFSSCNSQPYVIAGMHGSEDYINSNTATQSVQFFLTYILSVWAASF